MDAHLVLAFVAATELLSLVPGPDMLFVIANGVSGGKRAGVIAALGMSTGLAVHTLAAALGMSLLLSAAPQALVAVRLGGGAVLLYLAVTTWLSSRRVGHEPENVAARPRRSLRRTYIMATLTNLANPKVILFYLAFLPQFLTTGTTSWPVALQMAVLGMVFILVGLSIDSSAGVLSGVVADKILARPKLRQRMEQGSALVFAGLGAGLVLDSSH